MSAANFELVVKRDCPTCVLIEPVCHELLKRGIALKIYTQDDTSFPAGISDVVDDRELEHSFHSGVEIVPTLIRRVGNKEVGRTYGWDREEWCSLTGLNALGDDLPASRPGCGALNVEPEIAERLELRFGATGITARPVDLPETQDEIEACYERGWSDGLPVVPPTPLRVLRMLKGTQRDPAEIIGHIPPGKAVCTVEKVAINAVLAGCKPEYLPVVLSAVEAVLEPEFAMHGVLATTDFASPIVIVNGPIARRIEMNSGVNALGQGNRANATIGRAVQLVIRNMGGGVPGGIDRSTLGQPGKYTCCFAENEDDETWEPLSVERGFPRGTSTVTVFAGFGVHAAWTQFSRAPESLTRSLANNLNSIANWKNVHTHEALMVISPEHHRIYREAGWDRARIKAELIAATARPGAELIRGVDGIDDGMPEEFAGREWTKFESPDHLHLVRAGGPAGMVSAIMPGWWRSSRAVTREISI